MSGAPGPDRGPIAFAEKLMTVLAYGRKTATYKYAVLLASIDLCREQSSIDGRAPRSLRVIDLAAKVVELYWPHTVPFDAESGTMLTQNVGGRQAETKRQLLLPVVLPHGPMLPALLTDIAPAGQPKSALR